MSAGIDPNMNENERRNQEKKLKNCIVHFRPKKGWKGEYGFDWFKEPWDWDDKGTNSDGVPFMHNFENIGKHVCGASSATISYNRSEDRITVESVPNDESNFYEDATENKTISTRYVIDHKMAFPVLKFKGKDYVVSYDGEYKQNRKMLVFTYKHKVAVKKQKKSKKESKATQEETEILYRYHIEYEDGELKLWKVARGRNNTYEEIDLTNKTQKALTKNEKRKWNIPNEYWKSVKNNRNMDKKSLLKNTNNIIDEPDDPFVEICDSRIYLDITESHTAYHVEYENGRIMKMVVEDLINRKRERYVGIKEIKGKLANRDILSCSRIQIWNFLQTLNYNTVTIKYVPAVTGLYCIETEIAGKRYDMINEEKITKVESLNRVVTLDNKLKKKSEDNVLEEVNSMFKGGVLKNYWEDYVDGRFFDFRFKKSDLPALYFFSTLSLTQFGKKRQKDWDRDAKDQAEILAIKEGQYDEIKFVSSNKNLVVSPKSISGDKNDIKLKVKLVGLCNKEETIIAYSEDKVVGVLQVKVFPPMELNVCVINTTFTRRQGAEVYPVKGILPGNRRWDFDKDSRHEEIMGQAGIILKMEKMEMEYDQEEFESYIEHSDKLSDDVVAFPYGNPPSVSFSKRMDDLFLESHPKYRGMMRVYLVNKYYMSNYSEAEYDASIKPNIPMGWMMPNEDEVVVVFQKSIEHNGFFDRATLAHALIHCLGLKHNFDNRNKHTMKISSTENVMDYENPSHALNSYQWEEMRNGHGPLIKKLGQLAKKY